MVDSAVGRVCLLTHTVPMVKFLENLHLLATTSGLYNKHEGKTRRSLEETITCFNSVLGFFKDTTAGPQKISRQSTDDVQMMVGSLSGVKQLTEKLKPGVLFDVGSAGTLVVEHLF